MDTLRIPVSDCYLISGVKWRSFSSKSPIKGLRKTAYDNSASSYAPLMGGKLKNDLYALLEQQDGKLNKLYPLAAVLAKHANGGAAAVILKTDTYFAACCVNEMTPILDKFYNNEKDAIAEVLAIATKLRIKALSNYATSTGITYVEDLEFKLLGEKKHRPKSFREIPASQFKYIAYGTVLVITLLWYVDSKREGAERAEAARIKAQIDADPVPKYIKSRMREEGGFALKPATVHSMLSVVGSIESRPKGWKLSEVICNNSYRCNITYLRSDGVFSELRSQLTVKNLTWKPSFDLNKAEAEISFDKEGFVFPEYEKSYSEFIAEDFGDKAQDWLTAGLGIALAQPALWPVTSGVKPNFKHPMALQVGTVKISDVSLYLFPDLIKEMPANMHIKSFTIKTIDVNKELEAKVMVDGVFHVK